MLRSGARSDVIDHVVYISFGSQTFDAMLGDPFKDVDRWPNGQNGEPTLNIYPENVTPNLQLQLARSRAGLADTFRKPDPNPDIARGSSR